MKKNWIIALLLGVALAFGGCKSKEGHKEGQESTTVTTEEVALNDATLLEGAWEVEELNGKSLDGVHPNITFDLSKMQIYGHLGCNDFNGSLRLEGNEGIGFSHLTSTRMLCEEMVMEREGAFADALEKSSYYMLDKEGKLTLLSQDKAPLVKLVRM